MVQPVAFLAVAQGPSPVIWFYLGFIGLVIGFLALDLGVFHRKAHEVTAGEAAAWSAVWTGCALAFTAFVYFGYQQHWLGLGLDVPVAGRAGQRVVIDGLTAAEQYLTGYVIEWSLSVDNLFVIALIFSSFGVPAKYQHRVLFWGILGALAMRGGMIALGAVLLRRFEWITYVFGGFLVLTAIKMALSGHQSVRPERNILVRAVRAVWPVTTEYDGQRFFTQVKDAHGAARRAATPLLLALLAVEFTDLVFAVDSVPAIFAITGDPFIVLTSNVFAILGLRSLYFLLANMLDKFRYLKASLVLILLFVGVKLLLVHTELKVGAGLSLAIVAALLGGGIAASLLVPARRRVVCGATSPAPGARTRTQSS